MIITKSDFRKLWHILCYDYQKILEEMFPDHRQMESFDIPLEVLRDIKGKCNDSQLRMFNQIFENY